MYKLIYSGTNFYKDFNDVFDNNRFILNTMFINKTNENKLFHSFFWKVLNKKDILFKVGLYREHKNNLSIEYITNNNISIEYEDIINIKNQITDDIIEIELNKDLVRINGYYYENIISSYINER